MLIAALARHLVDLGHGTYDVTDASVVLGELPGKPVDATALAVKAGPPDATVDGWAREGVQVIVRRSAGTVGRYRAGYLAARAIRDALNGLMKVTLAEGTDDETRLVWLQSDDSGPYPLGDDATGTPRWGLRFSALTRHDTEHTTL